MALRLLRPIRLFSRGVRRLNAGHATRAQRNHQYIILGVQQLGQLPAQTLHLPRRHPAAEYRVLHTLAVPFHVRGRLTQSLRIVDIVTDKPPAGTLHGRSPTSAAVNERTNLVRPSILSPKGGLPTQ